MSPINWNVKHKEYSAKFCPLTCLLCVCIDGKTYENITTGSEDNSHMYAIETVEQSVLGSLSKPLHNSPCETNGRTW